MSAPRLRVGVVVGEVGPDLDEDRADQGRDEGAPRGSSPTPLRPAAAVPTSTGAIAAGSVRGRAAISQILIGRSAGRSRRFGNFEKSGVRPLA